MDKADWIQRADGSWQPSERLVNFWMDRPHEPLRILPGDPLDTIAAENLRAGCAYERLEWMCGGLEWLLLNAKNAYCGAQGSPPKTVADLGPYCFVWPMDGLRGTGIALIGDYDALLAQESVPIETIEHGGLQIGVKMESDAIRVVVPRAHHPSGESFTYHFAGAGIAGDDCGSTEGLLDSRAAYRQSDDGHEYEIDDFRLMNAQAALSAMVASLAQGALEMPATVDRFLSLSGKALINLEPTDRIDPQLSLGFDGKQAYLINANYPSGFSDGEVIFFFELQPGGFAMERTENYRNFKEADERTFTQIGAWNLVPTAEAQLPFATITSPRKTD